MFERFTENARQVVLEAQRFAHETNATEIYPAHLLVGCVMVEDGGARTALLSFRGVEEIRENAAKLIADIEARRDPPVLLGAHPAPSPNLEFRVDSKRVLEHSLRSALSLGHNYIGTEHILLALCRTYPNVIEQVVGPEAVAGQDKVASPVARYVPGELEARVLDIISGRTKLDFLPVETQLDWTPKLRAALHNMRAEHRYLAKLLDDTEGVAVSKLLAALRALAEVTTEFADELENVRLRSPVHYEGHAVLVEPAKPEETAG